MAPPGSRGITIGVVIDTGMRWPPVPGRVTEPWSAWAFLPPHDLLRNETPADPVDRAAVLLRSAFVVTPCRARRRGSRRAVQTLLIVPLPMTYILTCLTGRASTLRPRSATATTLEASD